jgi:hypothetical protein
MQEIINRILIFIYSIAHLIGTAFAKFIQFIFPDINLHQNIIDTIGFLSVLTLFLILIQAAKKIAWIIVIAGWILVLIRVVMVIL